MPKTLRLRRRDVVLDVLLTLSLLLSTASQLRPDNAPVSGFC